jgi:hypothetical protein
MTDDLNRILAEFGDAAARPGGARLEDWVKRYPHHERALVQYAVYDYVFEQCTPASNPQTEATAFLAQATAVRERMCRSAAVAATPLSSILAAAKELGMAPAAFAQRLGLSAPEVTKLDRRLFRVASLPRTLVAEVASALNRSMTDVIAYLRMPATLSPQASYKADHAPRTTAQEEFGQAVQSSRTMTEELKARWRAECENLLGDAE